MKVLCRYHARPAILIADETPMCHDCAWDYVYDLEDAGHDDHADDVRSNILREMTK